MREKKFAHEKNISVLIVQKKVFFCENVKKRSHLYGLAHIDLEGLFWAVI